MARQNQIKHDSNARQDEKLLALRLKLGWEGYGLYWGIIEILRDRTDHTGSKDYNEIAFELRVSAGLIKQVVEGFGLFTFTDCGKRFYSKRLSHDMDKRASISAKRRQAAQERWGDANADASAMQVQCKCNANASSDNDKGFNELDNSRLAGVTDVAIAGCKCCTDKKQEKVPLSSPFPLTPLTPNSIPPIIPQKELYKGAQGDFCETAESESSVEPKQQSAGADKLPPPPPPVENAKRSVFTPPTEEEVAKYAEAKGYAGFETERFVDFYASKGWYVGKNRMRDWRAAVRNWWRGQKERNNRINQTSNGTDKYANRRGREGAVAPAESFANWNGKF